MSDAPLELDLKFLPDWVKETPSTNRYADYQGESDDREGRSSRSRDDRGGPRDDRRGPRPGGRGGPPPRRDQDRRGPGPRSDRPPGGPRPGGPRPPGGDRPRSGRPGDRQQGGRSYGHREDSRPPREAPRPAPATLRVDFLPEPNAAAGISRQIKASGRAYPVFGTGKLFLERPERHRVRVTSEDSAVPLFQIGDGPISFDRAAVERNAFFTAKADFYTEETVQGEPIKGNFSNVARVRGTGTLLGPTNYHSYQPALRKLYEERYSRRMPFQEFQQREIEIVSDEQAVADWKEQARTSTTYTTTKEAEPMTFKSAFDTEQHFRKHYLPELVKSGTTLECSGQASRSGADRFVSAAVRSGWEKESHFPQQIVNGLRQYFMEAGLHYFKHRKRVLYVSSTKPVRHPAGQVFSDGITTILATVEANPRIKRPELAAKILGDQHDSPDAAPRKEQLASDLHYLVHTGHVIEFSNGMLELPLAPQDKSAGDRAAKPAVPASGGAAAESHEAAAEPTDESTVTELGEAEHSAPASSEEHVTPSSEATIGGESIPSQEAVEPGVSSEAATPESTAAESEPSHAAPESSEETAAPPESPASEEHVESVSTVQNTADVAEAAPVHVTTPETPEPEVEVAANPGSPL